MIVDDLILALLYLLAGAFELMAYVIWKFCSLIFKSWARTPPKFVKERIKIQLLRNIYNGLSPEAALKGLIQQHPKINVEEMQHFQSIIPALRSTGYREADMFREGKVSKATALANIEMEFPGLSDKFYKDVLAMGLHESR